MGKAGHPVECHPEREGRGITVHDGVALGFLEPHALVLGHVSGGALANAVARICAR